MFVTFEVYAVPQIAYYHFFNAVHFFYYFFKGALQKSKQEENR